MRLAPAADRVQRAGVELGRGPVEGRPHTCAKAQIARELRERERWFELCDIYRAHIDATLPPAEKDIRS